jgi:hypothetical protein
MAKVIKIKQSDIEKIVENILKENPEFDDFDTKIQPEELPGYDEADIELSLGQDEEGNYYVMKNNGENTPEIVLKTK